MYVTVSNDIMIEKLEPDSKLYFGQKGYPIISFYASLVSTKISDILKKDPTIKEFKFSCCSDAISKAIADFMYGKAIEIGIKNADLFYKISLEMGIISIIESCQLIMCANEKITGVIAKILNNEQSDEILDFVAHYFGIFSFYEEFNKIPVDTLEKVISRDALGISSEKNFYSWLSQYQENARKIDPTEKKTEELFKKVLYDTLDNTTKIAFWKAHKNSMNSSHKEEFPIRMLIDRADSKGFKPILTQIINTDI